LQFFSNGRDTLATDDRKLLRMSASQAQALSAIAFQFAAALQAYEEDVERLLQSRFDPEVYQRTSARMDEMRMYAAAIPTVSGAWVEVLIRHFEFTHALFRAHQQRGAGTDLPRLYEQLQHAIERLSQRCLQLVPAP
jgi:hypothetical protein